MKMRWFLKIRPPEKTIFQVDFIKSFTFHFMSHLSFENHLLTHYTHIMYEY